jgi:MFS family permease
VSAPAPARAPARVDSAEGWRNTGVAFVSMFVVFGVAYSFGAFFEPMAEEFGAGSGATSAVFSITAFCYFVLGSVSGRAVDRFGPRPVLLAGGAAMGIGLALTSQVQALGLGYVTYGLGVGIGVACGYVPMVAVVGTWFQRHRGAALGLAVAGIGVGTLTVAPLAAALIQRWGWRTTYLLFAAASALLLGACALLSSPPPPQPGEGAPRVAEVVRTRNFASLYGSTLFGSLALFVPFVFLPPFAAERGAGQVAAAALVGVIGVASVAGRLLIGLLADRFGRVRSYQACFAVMAVSYALWLVASSYPLLVLFAIVLGVGYGGFIALNPAVVAELFGTQGLGGLVGLLYTSAAVGSLLGPPAAGLLIDGTGTYTWAILACIVAATASFAALLPLRPGTGG